MSNQYKTESWANSCLRKKALSEDIANKIVKRATGQGEFLRSYLCPHCGKFHVTSKPINPNFAKGGNNGN